MLVASCAGTSWGLKNVSGARSTSRLRCRAAPGPPSRLCSVPLGIGQLATRAAGYGVVAHCLTQLIGRAAAAVAVRNALARREREKRGFSNSSPSLRSRQDGPSLLPISQQRPSSAGAERQQGQRGLWRAIFGSRKSEAQSGERGSASYSRAGIARAEQKSIERVMDVTSCSEADARQALKTHGWSVHETVSSLLNVNKHHLAPASLGAHDPATVAQEAPSEEDQMLAAGLFLSVVPDFSRQQALQHLRCNGWNVQAAIQEALEANPSVALFDGKACQVPVGIPLDDEHAGRSIIPRGQDVWETQSAQSSAWDEEDTSNHIPIGVAVVP